MFLSPPSSGVDLDGVIYLSTMDLSYIINHLGEERENYFGAVAPPIIQTSNFAFKDVGALRAAFTDEKNTHVYSRGNNPTVEILCKKIAALAGADDALVLASGTAAIAAAILANVKAGSHVVCVNNPYSWTTSLLTKFLPKFGVEHTFIDGTNAQHYADATRPNTSLYILESPNSFSFALQDVKAVADIAKERGIVTMIDNTYCTSIGQRCIEMGIDIEVHSGSKYYGGHSDVIAGCIIGNKEMIERIFHSELMNIGAIISPQNAWLMLRGLRTLPMRLDRIKKTTEEVVAFMKNHPLVEKITYPFDKTFPQYKLAKQQMLWCGGLFNVRLKAKDVEAVELFCNSLKAFLLAVSWGGHESLVIPACSFHPKDYTGERAHPFNLVRIYIGLEDSAFLTADLKQALAKIE